MISARKLIGRFPIRLTDSGDLRPRERILLALRWHDWIEPFDLYDQLDIERGSHERNAYAAALSKLVKARIVERDVINERHGYHGDRLIATSYVRLKPRRSRKRTQPNHGAAPRS